MDWESLRDHLEQYGQAHLLQHIGELDEAQKSALYADIKSINFSKLSRLWTKAQQSMCENGAVNDERLKPLDSSIVGSTAKDKDTVTRWSDIGEPDLRGLPLLDIPKGHPC